MSLLATDISKRARGEVSPRTVVRAADRGELPCARTPGGVRVFTDLDADRWLISRGIQLELATS